MTAVIRVAASHPCSSDCEGQPTAEAARGEGGVRARQVTDRLGLPRETHAYEIASAWGS